MKKFFLILFLSTSLFSFAQDTTSQSESKATRKEEKRQRRNAIIKQEEEGVLAYNKQNSFGLQLRTNGYGIFYELGRAKSPRSTNLYLIEITEIKHPKEEKSTNTDGFFSNSFVYGKVNNFYQAKIGFGKQYIFGQKGNKNGIAVMGIYQGGLSVGLLRPYYLNIYDDGTERDIKYDSPDSALFLSGANIIGSSGLGKGWSEMKMKPGAFVKTSLRFDFGRFNEQVQAIEIGLSVDAYAKKIEIMAPRDAEGFEAVKPKQFFFQGHIAFVFGNRR